MTEPLRVLHAADIHVPLRRYQTDPLGRLRDLAEVATAQRPELVVIAGDLFHHRGPYAASDLAEVVDALRTIGAAARLVVVDGNHDGPDTVGDPGTKALRFLARLMPDVFRLDFGTWGIGDAWVTTIPYPHRRALDDLHASSIDAEREVQVGAELERAIRELGAALPDDGLPRIAVGHLSVAGALLGTEQAMRFGWDPMVTPGAFEAWDYVALGHIHRQQKVSDRAYYAGSPEYHDFGEEGQPKGFLMAEVRRGEVPVVRRVRTRGAPMMTWRYVDEGLPVIPPGATVRVQLPPGPAWPPDALANLRATMVARGAGHVEIRAERPERPESASVDTTLAPRALITDWAAENVPDEALRAAVVERAARALEEAA